MRNAVPVETSMPQIPTKELVRMLSKDEITAVLEVLGGWYIDGDTPCPRNLCADFVCKPLADFQNDPDVETDDADFDEYFYGCERPQRCMIEYVAWCKRYGYDHKTGKRIQK